MMASRNHLFYRGGKPVVTRSVAIHLFYTVSWKEGTSETFIFVQFDKNTSVKKNRSQFRYFGAEISSSENNRFILEGPKKSINQQKCLKSPINIPILPPIKMTRLPRPVGRFPISFKLTYFIFCCVSNYSIDFALQRQYCNIYCNLKFISAN